MMGQKMYWAVWVIAETVQIVGDRRITTIGWVHHQSLDTKDDAEIEAHYCRRGGERTEIRRQDW